jgi:hypothetical protein
LAGKEADMRSVAVFFLFGPVGLWLDHRRDHPTINKIVTWSGIAVCGWVGSYLLILAIYAVIGILFFAATELLG